MSDVETGWLIEYQIGGRAVWWRAIEKCGRAWTTDASEAIRFSRKCDAQNVAQALGMRDYVVTDHAWVPG